MTLNAKHPGQDVFYTSSYVFVLLNNSHVSQKIYLLYHFIACSESAFGEGHKMLNFPKVSKKWRKWDKYIFPNKYKVVWLSRSTFHEKAKKIINRPGVAGAVLQTALLLTD